MMLRISLFALLVGVAVAKYCHRPNLDCWGSDIRGNFDADVTACKAACDAEPTCLSIQSMDGKCWLKSKACANGELNPMVNANDYVKYDGACGESAYARTSHKYCRRVDTDCFGHDIKHLIGVADLDACQDLCDYLPNCKSIQFKEGGNCWLKQHACANSELVPHEGGNDYVKAVDGNCADYRNPRFKYCRRNNMDCYGHDIHQLGWAQTLKQCMELCDFNSECKSIQYKTPDCWLKKHACSNDELAAKLGYADYKKVAASASCGAYRVEYLYRYCDRPGKDCGGHDIMSLKTDNVDFCQYLCSYKTECKSIQYFGGNCYLKRHACTNAELKDLAGATDYIRIARSGRCATELANLA